MATQTSPSDSLVGSLCREASAIRQRGQMVLTAMRSCQNDGLMKRLRQELHELDDRRRELREMARKWRQRRCMVDDLALDFLIEISSRSIAT